MHVRAAQTDDLAAILALWAAEGLAHDPTEDRRELEALVRHDPDLVLVGIEQDRVVASVIGTYDHHRGRIKRCVVDRTAQRGGLGRQLVGALEDRFAARGITELRLEVWADNVGAQRFWEGLGWEHQPEIRYYTRSLSGSDNAC